MISVGYSGSARVLGRHSDGPGGVTTQARGSLGEKVHEIGQFTRNFVEKQVKLVKILAFHVPMSLLGLAHEIEGIRQVLIQQGDQLLTTLHRESMCVENWCVAIEVLEAIS